MEVGDHPSLVCFNIHSHLGGEMGETSGMRHFWTKLVCYSPRFRRWDRGSGVLWDKIRSGNARETRDHSSVGHFNIHGYLSGKWGNNLNGVFSGQIDRL